LSETHDGICAARAQSSVAVGARTAWHPHLEHGECRNLARHKSRITLAALGVTRVVVLATCAAMVPSPSTPTIAQDPGWRQAMDHLAAEKTLAEGCASILKGWPAGNPMARVQGERLYVRAKADVDGLIALLLADLADDRPSANSPELEQRLTAVPKQRQALCRHVDLAIASEAGSLVEAAVAIRTAYRGADAARREAIDAEIMAARWRPYALVPAP